MTLSVSEAKAVQQLGAALLDLLGTTPGDLRMAQRAQHLTTGEAAVLLAEAAHKRLGAGPSARDVAAAWTAVYPAPTGSAGASK